MRFRKKNLDLSPARRSAALTTLPPNFLDCGGQRSAAPRLQKPALPRARRERDSRFSIANQKSKIKNARRLLRSLSYCAAVFFLAGCVTERKSAAPAPRPAHAPAPSGLINEINVLAMPVAVKLGSQPFPDGVAIKVYANQPGSALPVPIVRGSLEVLMFDGALNLSGPQLPPPLHVWTFTASELASYQFQSSIGPGYELNLPWGKDVPQQNRVTIIVRYLSPTGQTIYSAPNPITVGSS